ncbi:hypothetical protein B0H21DRAFT_822904 [Amylocystis lapponica]|nr:hypothetical protein B0H21DRAFT_822904 [Amylocystis lapponica]
MATSSFHLPPKGQFLQAINQESIRRLLLSPSFTGSFARLRASHGYALPLVFPSILAELNLLATLSLLNFASGYRVPLHAATGRGAFDNIRALVFGLHISASTGEGDYLSARGMRAIKEPTIMDLMGVSGAVHVERAHESIPGVTVGELGGPIWDLVKLVTQTLNETGAVLTEAGYPDLGSFVLEAWKEGDMARRANSDAEDVECELVRLIPAFRDMAVVDNKPIYCFKKALLTIHAIALRFGSADTPPAIPVPRTKHLPIFSDNVIPSMLIHLGVIDLSTSTPSLGINALFPGAEEHSKLDTLLASAPSRDPRAPKSKEVPKEGPRLTTEQAYILRAAAIDACELIVETARTLNLDGLANGADVAWLKEITLPELDAWLWAVAKDREDYRKLERFVLRDTAYF